MRTPVIAGNWKMNLNLEEALALVNGIQYGLLSPGEVDVIVAPTFLWLPQIADHLRKSYISVAAQNMHFKEQGAYTGECSGPQIREAGADYVIVGHSERRHIFGESDTDVNQKIKTALGCGLTPIVCLGETLEEREKGGVESVIENQLANGLAGLSSPEAKTLNIAYEPVWAIGTGRTASLEQVEEVHYFIRSWLASCHGRQTADAMRILYGGSVNPDNCRRLLALPNVDGALVGGASLIAEDFIQIIKSAQP